MGVPECPCVAPLRQPASTAATTVSPSTNSPDSTLTRCTNKVLAIFCTSVTAARALSPAPVPLTVPTSAIWPPDSAYSGVRSKTSSTRSAPAPSACDTTGTRLPSMKMPRILASEVNSSKPVNSVGPASNSSTYAVGVEVGMRMLARGGVGLGAAALLGHQFAETGLVERQTGLRRHLQREL